MDERRSTIEVVCVPVTDIDKAKAFYADQIGFTVDYDHTHNEEYRVVQLTPPGSGCSIALSKGTWTWQADSSPELTETEPGSLQGLQLIVSDVDATRAELLDRGVDVSEVLHYEDGGWVKGRGGRWNSFVFFNDPDGNGWILQERPED